MLFLHWVGNRFLSLVTNVLYNTTLSDMETCYKLFDRARARRHHAARPTASTSSPRSRRRSCAQGIRIYEVPISYTGREFDEGKKITWRDGFAALWTLVKYRFVRLSRCARPTAPRWAAVVVNYEAGRCSPTCVALGARRRLAPGRSSSSWSTTARRRLGRRAARARTPTSRVVDAAAEPRLRARREPRDRGDAVRRSSRC